MQANNQFQDKFSQYLAVRLGDNRASQIIYSNHKSNTQTPHRQSWKYSKN